MDISRVNREINEPYHLKYRPADFDGVVGQSDQINSLKAVLRGNSVPTSFLLVGSSGVGKTTIARIIAKTFGYATKEIDVASNNSAEHARELVESLEMNSLFSLNGKFLILDEVHTASKVFFGVLLKTLEEPPARTAFALCTTDPGKIPANILTRCHQIRLGDVPAPVLQAHLDQVCGKEGITLPKGATKQIVLASKGSVRQGLVYLSACRDVKSLDDLTVLLAQESVDEDAFQTVRDLAMNGSPVMVMGKLKRLQENGVNPVAVHAMARSYFLKMLLNAKSDKEIFKLTEIVDCLNRPVYEWVELAVIVGQILTIKYSR